VKLKKVFQVFTFWMNKKLIIIREERATLCVYFYLSPLFSWKQESGFPPFLAPISAKTQTGAKGGKRFKQENAHISSLRFSLSEKPNKIKIPKNCPSCGHRKGEALFLYCTDEQMLEISLLLLLLSSKVTFSFWRLNNLFLSFSKREKERNHSKF